MLAMMWPALRVAVVTWVLCGVAYPLIVTGLGQWLLPFQANGSMQRSQDGTVIGSPLIGQQWSGKGWFHGRPSATTDTDPADPSKTISAPYNAARSGASNFGPTNKLLAERLSVDRATLEKSQPELIGTLLPADMLTASGSGLDPDITPADATLQAPRVARALGVPTADIEALVRQHITGRSLGVFGEPRVNVLALNLALQRAYPKR
jgi:potassium-transporting ATPase KdpC subunit